MSKHLLALIMLFVSLGGLFSFKEFNQKVYAQIAQSGKWTAPAWTDTLIRQSIASPIQIKGGKTIYLNQCIVCHGENGRGDGESGFGLSVPPGDFNDSFTLAESDGSLYWKITFGRGPMPSFLNKLSEEQRWQLVFYIRDLQQQFRYGKIK